MSKTGQRIESATKWVFGIIGGLMILGLLDFCAGGMKSALLLFQP